jgi:two-component system sensor histidine kinase YesM
MEIYKLIKSFLQKKFSSFRNKLLLSFIISSVIPVLIIGLLAYSLSYSIAKKNILNVINHSSTQFNDTISNRFTQMKNVAETMQYYVYLMIFDKSQSITSHLDRSSYVRNYISSLKDSFNFYNVTIYLRPDIILSNEGITFRSTSDLSERGIIASKLNNNMTEWKMFKDQKTPIVLMKKSNPVDYISCYRAMKNKNSGELEYVYFIDINEREIAHFLNSKYPDLEISSYIVDKNGYIVSHPRKEMLGAQIDENLLSKIISSGDNTIFLLDRQLVVKRNEVTGWYVVTEVPNSYIFKNTSVLSKILLVDLVLVVVFTILVVFFISNNLSKKINNISDIIKKLTTTKDKDKLNGLIALTNKQVEYRDEVDQLAVAFRDMFLKLDKSFDQILEMGLQEEKLKYQLLQAKINPHFLYNILDSIKICHSIGKISDANAMIDKLAKFYRLSLRKGDELITIKDELEIALLYLEMECICHNESFQWKISLDDGIEEFLIPKFTLQPLLENCILHGLKSSGEKMLIDINIRYGEESIIITISDNGLGINPDTLAQIKSALYEKKVDVNQFYGISNVNARLSMYSANKNCMDIDSTQGMGTTVYISIEQMI